MTCRYKVILDNIESYRDMAKARKVIIDNVRVYDSERMQVGAIVFYSDDGIEDDLRKVLSSYGFEVKNIVKSLYTVNMKDVCEYGMDDDCFC